MTMTDSPGVRMREASSSSQNENFDTDLRQFAISINLKINGPLQAPCSQSQSTLPQVLVLRTLFAASCCTGLASQLDQSAVDPALRVDLA
jgi:hypothetical protein